MISPAEGMGASREALDALCKLSDELGAPAIVGFLPEGSPLRVFFASGIVPLLSLNPDLWSVGERHFFVYKADLKRCTPAQREVLVESFAQSNPPELRAEARRDADARGHVPIEMTNFLYTASAVPLGPKKGGPP